MLSEDRIKEIIEDCKDKGYEIKVRDISFMILSKYMPDDIAYKSLFYSEDLSSEEYVASTKIVFLKSYWKYNINEEMFNSVADVKGITYDENKSAMEQLIRDLTRSIENDDYSDEKSKITAQKTVADLRIKLSEKFNVASENKEQVVQVETKFNFICPHTRKECFQPSLEEIKKKYNLIENK